MSDNPETPDSAVVTHGSKPPFRLGCLGYCVCIFLLLIATWICIKIGMVRALNAELDRLRAAGEPVTWEEVIDSIEPLPDEENSALVLQRDLANLSAWSDTSAGTVVVTRPEGVLGVRRSDEMTKLMRVCLTDASAALKLLHVAAEHPSGRWPVEPHPFIYTHRLDYLSQIRSAGRLLKVETELRAADGDGHGAALSIRAARRLAASLDGSPYMIGALVRFAIGAYGVEATESALGLTELPAADLAMLRDEFAAEAEQLDLRAAVRTDRAGLLWLITGSREMLAGAADIPRGASVLFGVIPGLLESDALFGLRYLTEWVDLLTLPPRESLAAGKLRDAELARAVGNWKAAVRHPISALIMGSHGRANEALLRAKLRLHVARAALAVEQFRMERGRWPAKLADVVPAYLDAVPQDWFAPAGTPVRYAQTSHGARVWSAGSDNPFGLTQEDRHLRAIALDILVFYEDEGRLPKTLDELDELWGDDDEDMPVDPSTGESFTYVTHPANPDLFILGGFTGGLTEAEFWGQKLTTGGWVARHQVPTYPVVFRLLNPELRGIRRGRFADEVVAVARAEQLHKLGYTPERLKELGFSDAEVRDYKQEVEYLNEEAGQNPASPPQAPNVPPDTQAEVMP
jgi:hypothetical protein